MRGRVVGTGRTIERVGGLVIAIAASAGLTEVDGLSESVGLDIIRVGVRVVMGRIGRLGLLRWSIGGGLTISCRIGSLLLVCGRVVGILVLFVGRLLVGILVLLVGRLLVGRLLVGRLLIGVLLVTPCIRWRLIVIGAENVADAIAVVTDLVDLRHLSSAIVDLTVGIGIVGGEGHGVCDDGLGFLEMAIGGDVVGGLPGLSGVVFLQIALPATAGPLATLDDDGDGDGDEGEDDEGDKGECRANGTLVCPESGKDVM